MSLKDIDELIAKHQYALKQIQITKQMDVQNKQTVMESLNTKNLSDTQKGIIMNTIKVYDAVIKLDDQSVETSKQVSNLLNQSRDALTAYNRSFNLENSYRITILLMIPFVYSVALIFFGVQKLAKFTTLFGLVLVIAVMIYFHNLAMKQTDELNNIVNENLKTANIMLKNSSEATAKGTTALEELANSFNLTVQFVPLK